MIRRLRFKHGVHPPDLKELTATKPIRRMVYPSEVVLPVRQHAGNPAEPIIESGARVERGDKIATACGFVSAPVHASAAGVVTGVDLWPHPDGTFDTAIRIAVDPYSPQSPRPRVIPEWEGLPAAEVVAAIQDGGVVGLGGAAFPTHVKLSPPPDTQLETLIINGAECEPYLTSDHRTMAEYPERVHFGIRIMMQCLGVQRAMIGIEKNKPDAIDALERTLPGDLDVTIYPLTVKYPQGAEKMLIQTLLGREVPSGQLPLNVGVIVQNVGSVAAIAEIFETGLPVVERIVTVTGRGVKNPANLIVPVGTKVGDLIEACGGLSDDASEIVFGGPMMGTPQSNLDTPIVKGTTGVVVLSKAESRRRASYPCIHCGRCLDACPVFLNPQRLGELARMERFEEMEAHHLTDCMLCGCCSYACPSNIPLSQLFQLAKTEVRRRKAIAA